MELEHTRTYLWTTYNCFTFLFISWVYRVGSLEWSILSTHRDGLVMSEDTSFLRGLSSVQFSCSIVSDSLATSWTAALQASLSIANSQSLLKLMSIELVMPSHPLSSPSPPTLNLPSIRVFSNEWVLHIKWPKYWSFSFSISPSNDYPRLISFRMDWLNLLAVQGTLKSLLQHHSSKASFFGTQLSL